MFSHVKASIEKFTPLSDEEFAMLAKKFSIRELRKRELLVREGEVCRFVVFIHHGSLRYFYDVDGEERTGQFFFENSWYTDYESFLTNSPSKQNIEAMEPSKLFMLPKKDLYELYDKIPRIERFGRIMAENAYLGNRKNAIGLLTESPEERYLKLLKERPQLIQRVPQHYIASYLGIKPQSLSRIRKRLAKAP
jgi:CRP/FNR family transcriptional regulator, anaerobic regulatory protein